ncbi:MAG TPA: pyridoxamine 5'-phosphate oxidase family protein [Thermomicrobiales bacterium]|nr:pyridoxamine 5'-phosphate oxidase family protein [Thermomicrobiales bacterium]
MGRIYAGIDERQRAWLEQQPLFFVSTAPLDAGGHLNVSPKGASGTFRVLGPNRVAYLDLIGSGIETVAHLRENGRIVLMFCAFNGPPTVLRLHGRGQVVQPDDPDFSGLLAHFDLRAELESTLRSIIDIDVTRISDSCGFVVPRMELVDERDQLFRWAEHQERSAGPAWKGAYERTNNSTNIDGLRGLELPDELTETERARFASQGRVI